VRAHRNGSTTSSSSNTVNIDYASNNNVAPIGLIRGASVVSPDVVKLDFDWKKDGPSSLLTIEKKNGAGWTNIHSTATGGSNSFNDTSTKTHLTDAEFRVIRTNDCGVNDDTSYSHKTILLTENQRVMGWTSHLGWSNNAINTDFDYHLEIKSGFTWNELYSGKSLSFALPSNLYGNQTFRVSIFSNDGKLPINYSLYSNEIKVYLGFDATQFDTMLIPSAFNPNGINTVFKISNPAISAGESEMSVFNRWGEMIFNGDALVGWDGRDMSGSEVPQGTYVYLIQASYRNKKTRHSGTLLLIK
jgi:gliding motility-associated-like protein